MVRFVLEKAAISPKALNCTSWDFEEVCLATFSIQL